MTKEQETIKNAYDALKADVEEMFRNLQKIFPTVFSSWKIETVESTDAFIEHEMNIVESIRNELHLQNAKKNEEPRRNLMETLDKHIDAVRVAISSINNFWAGALVESMILILPRFQKIIFFNTNKLIRDVCAAESAKIVASFMKLETKSEKSRISVELMKYAAEQYPNAVPETLTGYDRVMHFRNVNKEHFPFSIPNNIAEIVGKKPTDNGIDKQLAERSLYRIIDAFDECFDFYYFIDRKHTPINEEVFATLDDKLVLTDYTIGKIFELFFMTPDSVGTVFSIQVGDRYNPTSINTYLLIDISTEDGLYFALELAGLYYNKSDFCTKLDRVLDNPYTVITIEDVLKEIQ